jgi:hypothetical protein
MNATSLPRLLTPAHVADWLSLPVQQVERMSRRGQLPVITLPGGELVFDPADLMEWLQRLRAQGQEVGHED